ncbi:hypothetical protein BU16DRAFT_535705 [Lophium mytilinum]|uniref:Uncharacterized protein n=1 Tax=Lophium mytilinum TaxID=390894 RepID=A0A6A6R462_9PEZI|nr:hypothetical protein BU16DRAFT_535705 [Lophium mytilinum]
MALSPAGASSLQGSVLFILLLITCRDPCSILTQDAPRSNPARGRFQPCHRSDVKLSVFIIASSRLSRAAKFDEPLLSTQVKLSLTIIASTSIDSNIELNEPPSPKICRLTQRRHLASIGGSYLLVWLMAMDNDAGQAVVGSTSLQVSVTVGDLGLLASHSERQRWKWR